MQHRQVIENFVREGKGSLGTYVRANEDVLYSRIPERYSPWGHRAWRAPEGQTVPLAVRLGGGDILANGNALQWPMHGHQRQVLKALEQAPVPFSVVPFHSIVAAWTDGKVREWDQAPIPVKDLQKEVGVVVPSVGERWQTVTVRDKHGRVEKRQIHTLGDSVVRIQDRFYISAVDETGAGSGMYFFAELLCDRAPASLEEALNFLKPTVVREAEQGGSYVRRQGEWFAVPTKHLTSELMRDVDRGIAVLRTRHVLGRDGHHELEEAVVYRAGPQRGEVYARGVLKHTQSEHGDLDLGTIRWHLIVHNRQGASYTLSGRGTAQFD